jgi:hypothetical protein
MAKKIMPRDSRKVSVSKAIIREFARISVKMKIRNMFPSPKREACRVKIILNYTSPCFICSSIPSFASISTTSEKVIYFFSIFARLYLIALPKINRLTLLYEFVLSSFSSGKKTLDWSRNSLASSCTTSGSFSLSLLRSRREAK